MAPAGRAMPKRTWLLAACAIRYSVHASRGSAAGGKGFPWADASQVPLGRHGDMAAPNTTRGFDTELQTLVEEVSNKISNSLNRSYSLAVREDVKYKQLREKLRAGLDDFVKGQEALQARAPREQMDRLAEVRQVLAGGAPEERGGGAPPTAHGAAAAVVPAAAAPPPAAARARAAGPRPAALAEEDEESSELRRRTEALRQELLDDGREEALEAAAIAAAGGRGAGGLAGLGAGGASQDERGAAPGGAWRGA